jgi:hypothetical protein
MVYGHTLTTYSIPQKENKCNHMITIVVGWESSLILLSCGPTGHFSSKPKNCPVGFVAIVSTSLYYSCVIHTFLALRNRQDKAD